MPKWDLLGGLGRVMAYVATGVAFVLLFSGLSALARMLRSRDAARL